MPYKTYQEGGRRSARGGQQPAKKEEEGEVEMKDLTNTTPEEDIEEEANEEGTEEKKPWIKRTKEGGIKKVPKEVQKRRRNFRLKKMLTPKAPIMILHELLGQTSVQYELFEPTAKPMPGLFTAKTTYDDQTFSGMGPSKSIAKNVCAEQVLQYITTKSCAGKEPAKEEEEDEGDQENGGGPKKGPRHDLETDTPWVSLASLALYKLFNDWQAQGYVIPPGMIKGSQCHLAEASNGGDAAGTAVAKPKKVAVPKADKTLPENAHEKHPVQLLNEMMGPMVYTETGQEGLPPNCIFNLSVTVNGETYEGQGKSKKEAKKMAAMSAVAAIYNIQYSSA